MKIRLRCSKDFESDYGYITNYGSFCFSTDWFTLYFSGGDNKRYIKIAKRLKIKRLV